jgi:hypothetical protein
MGFFYRREEPTMPRMDDKMATRSCRWPGGRTQGCHVPFSRSPGQPLMEDIECRNARGFSDVAAERATRWRPQKHIEPLPTTLSTTRCSPWWRPMVAEARSSASSAIIGQPIQTSMRIEVVPMCGEDSEHEGIEMVGGAGAIFIPRTSSRVGR